MAPRPRRGPRPLALHLRHAGLAWSWRSPKIFARFLEGIAAYRRHAYSRPPAALPVIWRRGSTALQDFGPEDGWPLLVVPSLVNRSYILDLDSKESLLAFLRADGIRPLVIDWGEPDAAERRMSMDDLIRDRLEGALHWICGASRARPLILGYCMGGLLSLALASRRPADVAGIALLATPWDFRAGGDRLSLAAPVLNRIVGASGGAGVDLLQTVFASIDPLLVPRKFVRFAGLDPESAAARRFVMVEDWLNDGLPLGAGIASTCLEDWYRSNAPVRGAWHVAGRPIVPQALEHPALLAVPAQDRIVPAESALALAAQLPRAEVIRPSSGHIGMIVGQKAKDELWRPLSDWLQRNAAMQRNNGRGSRQCLL